MKLKKLLYKIDYQLLNGNDDIEISDLTYDFNKKLDNSVFVAIVGNNIDGHNYIDVAINNGARVVIVSKNIELDDGTVVILVDDTSKILSRLSMNYFDNPHEKLTTIAITGTKGKTTTSFMIKNIIEKAFDSCGLIGTTGIYIKDKYYESKNTTPISYDILKYIDEMVKADVRYVVIEVSSQALKYDRVNGILFDYGIFTNLTEDHIGKYEHDDMDDYVFSKSKLFKQCKIGVLNLDDLHFDKMIKDSTCKVYTYGYNKQADLVLDNIKLYNDNEKLGINIDTKGVVNDKFDISVPGKFSSYNSASAILTCYLLGIDISYMKDTLNNFFVNGRVERINISDDVILYIDYAHNGISTKSILSTIREYNPKRIVTIFGCGGNRSASRRYEMGEMVGKYSSFCIITEDNNRYEEFEDIARDILVGINKTDCEYIIISDRKEAIRYAINNALPGDIIMLIGKGHETYKDVKGVKYHFDEREVIKEILSENKNSSVSY